MIQARSFSGSEDMNAQGQRSLGEGGNRAREGWTQFLPLGRTGLENGARSRLAGCLAGYSGGAGRPLSQFAAGRCPGSGWGGAGTLFQGWGRAWLCITSWRPVQGLPGLGIISPVLSHPSPAPGGPPLPRAQAASPVDARNPARAARGLHAAPRRPRSFLTQMCLERLLCVGHEVQWEQSRQVSVQRQIGTGSPPLSAGPRCPPLPTPLL